MAGGEQHLEADEDGERRAQHDVVGGYRIEQHRPVAGEAQGQGRDADQPVHAAEPGRALRQPLGEDGERQHGDAEIGVAQAAAVKEEEAQHLGRGPGHEEGEHEAEPGRGRGFEARQPAERGERHGIGAEAEEERVTEGEEPHPAPGQRQ